MSKDMKLIFEGWRSHLLEREEPQPQLQKEPEEKVDSKPFKERPSQEEIDEFENLFNKEFEVVGQELEKMYADLAKVTDESVKTIVKLAPEENPEKLDDTKAVTIGEFVQWMTDRKQSDKFGKAEEYYAKTIGKLKERASDGDVVTAKVASMILRKVGDINLRGFIGEALGDLGAKAGLDGLKTAFGESVEFALDQAGMPNTLGLRKISAWTITAIVFGLIKQSMTDLTEKAVDMAIQKISDSTGELYRDTMNTPEIKAMFDIPDEILDMLDNAPQTDKGDSRRLIRTFMSEYTNDLKDKLEQLQGVMKGDSLTDEEIANGLNQPLQFKGKGEQADMFARKALLMIRNAYNLNRISVTLPAGDEDKEKTITVESKRRRIVYRGKK